MNRRFSIFILFAVLGHTLTGQIGGYGVFSLLRQPSSARQASWGGNCNSYLGNDVGLIASNPALLNPLMENRGSMTFNTQFKGLWSGSGAFAAKIEKVGMVGISVAYIDYGKFDVYDAGGNPEGITNANESLLALSLCRNYRSRITYGASLKIAYSVLGPYVGNGVMLDLGTTYTSPDSVYTIGLTLRNAGIEVKSYAGGREPLPFNAELGTTFKPKHMPFRFNIVAHDLQKWDLTYNQYLNNSSAVDLSGNPTKSKEAGFGGKLLRHINVGTELVLGQHFGVLFSYNHQRRSELGPEVRKGMSGFSWGICFKVSKFAITYSNVTFFPGFRNNLFTVSSSMSEFKRKKNG